MGVLTRRVSVAAAVLATFATVAAWAEDVIVEGAGIQNGVSVGASIAQVEKAWGKADRVMAGPKYSFYEYRSRGTSVACGPDGKVAGAQFFVSPLPAGTDGKAMTPFVGRTVRGVRLAAGTTLEEVYASYGRPGEVVAPEAPRVEPLMKGRRPFAIDDGRGHVTAVYPDIRTAFVASEGTLRSVSVGDFFRD